MPSAVPDVDARWNVRGDSSDSVLQDLADRGKVHLEEGFVDPTFVAEKKGGGLGWSYET